MAKVVREEQMYLELVTGRHLLGRLKRFDRFTLVIESEGTEILIYKHAIITIQPIDPPDWDVAVAALRGGGRPRPPLSASATYEE